MQSTDVVLVFRTKQSVQNLMHGTFTLGADAAAAAGPFGRQASAATTAQMNAEVWSYSKSRGALLSEFRSMARRCRSITMRIKCITTRPPVCPVPPGLPSAYRLVTVLDSYLGISRQPPPRQSFSPPRLRHRLRRHRAYHRRKRSGVNSRPPRPTCMRPFPTKIGGNFLALPKSVYYENQPVDSNRIAGFPLAFRFGGQFTAVSSAGERTGVSEGLRSAEAVYGQYDGLRSQPASAATPHLHRRRRVCQRNRCGSRNSRLQL